MLEAQRGPGHGLEPFRFDRLAIHRTQPVRASVDAGQCGAHGLEMTLRRFGIGEVAVLGRGLLAEIAGIRHVLVRALAGRVEGALETSDGVGFR